jgi:hypothetical protein
MVLGPLPLELVARIFDMVALDNPGVLLVLRRTSKDWLASIEGTVLGLDRSVCALSRMPSLVPMHARLKLWHACDPMACLLCDRSLTIRSTTTPTTLEMHPSGGEGVARPPPSPPSPLPPFQTGIRELACQLTDGMGGWCGMLSSPSCCVRGEPPP